MFCATLFRNLLFETDIKSVPIIAPPLFVALLFIKIVFDTVELSVTIAPPLVAELFVNKQFVIVKLWISSNHVDIMAPPE